MTAARKRPGGPAAGEAGPRPAIWAALRAGTALSVAEAAAIGRCDKSSVRAFFACLVAGGVLREALDDPGRYGIVADPGPAVPRFRVDGSTVDQGTGRANAWRAMRILKTFSVRDLAMTAGISEADAQSYIHYLVKAGYLLVARPGRPGAKSTYRFNAGRYSGPLAPQVTRIKCVWDPNTGSVVWPVEPPEGAE